jgi:hypothetical protein
LKKYIPYILIFLLAIAVIFLLYTGNSKANRRMDERITLRKEDKIPYGTYAAYQNLKHIFPEAAIYTNRREPGYWDSLSNYNSGQAFIAVTDKFNATEDEMRRLVSFVEKGNDVFISTLTISDAVSNALGCSSNSFNLSFFSDEGKDDSLRVSLSDPPFGKENEYSYPGKKYSAYFDGIDSSTTEVIGADKDGRPNFIHLRAGKGNFYLQLEPFAFSNYFILHKNNIRYYENALSVIDPSVKKVVWDEYYRYKKGEKTEDKNWLTVLMNMQNSNGQKPFKAALWILVLLLLVYVLMEMRRKQRPIPVINKPKNDSLDFVKTIGRLYYDKGDHKNLCRKMGAYFLEHVRNRYKLSTGTLDDEFVKNLQFKSGATEEEIKGIVSFIKYADEAYAINYKELTNFHKQLESFYKKA